MVIINCIGGLGNQMFQYAFYRALRKRLGPIVKLYLEDFQGYNLHNGFELDRIFHILSREDVKVASKAERMSLPQFSYRQRICRRVLKMFGPKKLREKFFYIYALDGINAICYDERMFQVKDVFLNGYYQSEKYFISVSEEIRNDFV